MLILNFKNYSESTEENAVKLLDIIKNVQLTYPLLKNELMVAPSILDLVSLKKQFPEINIISQHVENEKEGNSTGWLTVQNLLDNKIEYSLYNHSEHRMWSDSIVNDIKTIQKKGLKLIVCCENIYEAELILQAKPYAIAYEPKDLIGSDISVTTRSELVTEFIEKIKGNTIPMIGAGVKTGDDIKIGRELGAKGFLIASGLVKSLDPYEKLIEFTSALLQK